MLFAGAAVLLLALFLYPFKTTIVPRWRLNVVDETRVLGVPDIRVTEHWQHYLLESEGHEEMQKTNQNGLVDFPTRTIRASLASRVTRLRDYGCGLSTRHANANRDCGSPARVSQNRLR